MALRDASASKKKVWSSGGNVFCDMGGSFGEIMELPKQLLYLRAQLGFMGAGEESHAEKKTNIYNKL